jgi:hypothetical protein
METRGSQYGEGNGAWVCVNESPPALPTSLPCFSACTSYSSTRLTLFAQPTNGNAWLLAAHDEIGVMLGHGESGAPRVKQIVQQSQASTTAT